VRQEHERRAAEGAQILLVEKIGDDDGRVLHEEIERLPEQYRRPIVLHYFEGMSHVEAASRLRWPIGTVRSRLARARERLRDRLIRRGLTLDTTYLCMLSRWRGVLPASLVDTTVQAAKQVAVHNAVEAGLLSASAAALAEGVFRTMFVTKLKAAAAILLAVGIVAAGIRIYAQQPQGSGAGKPTGALPAQAAVLGERTDEPGSDADELVRLVRRARREQSDGDMEAAVRDLKRLEEGAVKWRSELTSPRRRRDDTLPRAEPAAVPVPSPPGSRGAPQPGQPTDPFDPLEMQDDAQGRSSKRPSATISEHRLDVLERKVDGILVALEKIASQNQERLGHSSGDQKPVDSPPRTVEGRITKADPVNDRVEINIGSDDGLAPGHELTVWRNSSQGAAENPPRPIGVIVIRHTDPDRSFAGVIEWSRREPFKNGDRVSVRRLPVQGEQTPASQGKRGSTVRSVPPQEPE
jgi:hypothetical protein